MQEIGKETLIMIAIIVTLIICATVLYLSREVMTFIGSELAEARKTPTGFTAEDLDKAYEEAARNKELPPDITQVVKELMQDFELE